MRFALTGYTSGIGKELWQEFGGLGFCRADGYDIRDEESRTAILLETRNVDVFINCAHSEFGQVKLLEEWYEQFKDTEKIIINIGSLKMLHLQQDKNEIPSSMAYENAALENLFNQLLISNSQCKVGLLELGPVNTKKNKGPAIELDTVNDMVKSMIEYLQDNSRCHMKLLPEVK